MALSLARDAESLLRNRQTEAEEMMRGVRQAESESSSAQSLARAALEAAEAAQNRSESAKAQVDELVAQMDEFLVDSGAKPSEIRSLAVEVMGKSISLRPEQITDLAQKINDTISSLTNIDAILEATSGDLASAKALKIRADAAKANAKDILRVTEQVLASLSAAQEAQDRAHQAIQTADKVRTLVHQSITLFHRLAEIDVCNVTSCPLPGGKIIFFYVFFLFIFIFFFLTFI